MVKDLEDLRRAEPPKDGLDERAMLEAWLEFHRMTLLLKCEGLDDHARKARPVASFKLSLHGLVRHMAEVERSWFRRVLQREPGAPYIWFDPAIEDSEMVPLDGAVWETDLAAWQAECKASRRQPPPGVSTTPASPEAVKPAPSGGSTSIWSRSTPVTTGTPT